MMKQRLYQLASAALLTLPGMVFGQVQVEFEQNVAIPADGSTQGSMEVRFTNDANVGTGGIAQIQLTMDVPAGVTVEGCTDVDTSTGHVPANCDTGSGAGEFLFSYADLANDPIPNGVIFTIEFTVDSGTAGVFPIEFTDLTDQTKNTISDTEGTEIVINEGTNFDGTAGSIVAQCPSGQSCYSSDPPVGSEITFGEAVVNSATDPETITIDNTQDDGTNSFNVQSGTTTNPNTGSAASVTVDSPTLPATVPADGDMSADPPDLGTTVDVNFVCTPEARGEQSGIFQVNNNADLPTGPEEYSFTCTGTAPNPNITGTPVPPMTGLLGGTAPTVSFQIANPSGNFTSPLTQLQLNTASDAPAISVTDGVDSTTLAVDGTDTIAFSCDTSAEIDQTEIVSLTWYSPTLDETVSSGPIEVACTITDTAPVYGSDPESPGDDLNFATAFGTTEEQFLDVFNANPNGDAFNIESASISSEDIAGTFAVEVLNSGSFPGDTGSADGTDDLRITCTPEGKGLIQGELTIVTDSAGTQTYPLDCNGTGADFTFNPPLNGTLNLGTVSPETQTPVGSIDLENNFADLGGSPSFDFNCSILGGDTDEITQLTTSSVTVAPGETGSIEFQCTPSAVDSFAVNVVCTALESDIIGGDNPVRGKGSHVVECAGRPLVIPTLNHWGLILLSLIVLTLGGLVGRRMMA